MNDLTRFSELLNYLGIKYNIESKEQVDLLIIESDFLNKTNLKIVFDSNSNKFIPQY